MKISVILPCLFTDGWQSSLADFAIETMRQRTSLEFELVIVETGSRMLSHHHCVYVHRAAKTSYTEDFNVGIDESSGDYIVHTGIDVIVGDRWLEAMLECFERFHDCGAATIRIAESGAYIGPKDASDSFDEAMYGPLMMWRKEGNLVDDASNLFDKDETITCQLKQWRFDTAFPDHASDSDLVMRMYKAGLRSYRNNKAMAWHLNGVTWNADPEREAKRMKAHETFRKLHGDSPLWMANMIMRGGIAYGHEHEK